MRPTPANVTISGNVNYERIPFRVPGIGLNYPGKGFMTLNGVLVEVLNAATGAVIAGGSFPGEFQFTVPGQTDIALRATAQLVRQTPDPLPHWQFSVRDLNASGDPIGAIYSYTEPTFNSGAGGTHDLNIPSGWNELGDVTGTRHAAPFAILDSIHLALDRLSSIEPTADFPPLTIDWSAGNLAGQTFFTTGPGSRRIVLSGEANVDTEEYDQSVILHEFGHYIQDAFSRDDSIGGPHSVGDRLDMRVAFSEGFATAFGALVSNDPIYRDSFGSRQANEGSFNVNADLTFAEGWYSEFSTHEILWDLNNLDAMWTVLRGPLSQTDAATSVFPFFTALKQLDSRVETHLSAEAIVGTTINPYGSTETNNAGSGNVLPIYTDIALGGSVQVRSTNEFGTSNKLSTHRFLRFSLLAATNVRFEVSAASGRDPDLLIFRRGVSVGPNPGPANENFTLQLAAGEYVLDVHDCGNAGCNSNVSAAPTDITMSVTPN